MSPASLSVAALLQNRGVGLIPVLQDRLPRWGLEAFAAATHLGDTAVLLALATLVYLGYDRRDGAFVLGVLFAGFAVVIGTKAWFGLARPPADLQFVAETGFGFPSGHAIGATVGWGALAIVLDRLSTASRRTGIAAVVVTTVALSRVVIGVHYLVDVAAGVAIGLTILVLAARWGRGRPLALFGGAGGLAVIAVGVTGGGFDSVALLGTVVGALSAWQLVEPADRPYGQTGALASVGSGVVLAGASAVVAPSAAVGFVAGAVVTAGIMLLPMVAPDSFAGPN